MIEHVARLFVSPTSVEWMRFAAVLLGLFAFIGVGESIRAVLRFSPEVTRKLVHVLTGILIFFTPKFFISALPPLLMAVVFIAVNGLAIRLHLLKGMHGTGRSTYGTVYYPLAFLILVVLFWYSAPEIVSLSMLSLALGDAAAAIVGENMRNPTTYYLTSDRKSVEGSFAMFLSTAIALAFGMHFLLPAVWFSLALIILIAVAASTVATACEALSARGLDNLTIPLSVAGVIHVYLYSPSPEIISQFTLGVSFGLAIAAVSFYAKFLSASGSVATFLLATAVYGLGGWKWTAPILTFFVLSSLLSKVGRIKKSTLDSIFEKTGARDFFQVAANGGLAGMLVVAQHVVPSVNFFPAYLGSVAAATADTWGTEVGLLSTQTPRLITSLKPVERGANGAVTWLGMFGGAIGACLVAATAFGFSAPLSFVLRAVVGGCVGAGVDSLLGATVQAEYQCVACHKRTEKSIHCDQPTEFLRGIHWIDNDVVNWCCVISGAVVAALL
ncbi:MAG: DUF92 domain-containing protein [Ignavibacteriales bacterium]|nr:DUF92 domain-containing protein [Ignavibacteriales bacterium]